MASEEINHCATTSQQESLAIVLPIEDNICVNLSDRDADRVLEIVQNPPPPNEVARQAAERFKSMYGR